MRNCLLSPIGGLAAVAALSPSAAAAQAVTTASVRIQSVAGIQVTRGMPPRLLDSPGFIIFALSANANGSLDLSVLGFLPDRLQLPVSTGNDGSSVGTTFAGEAVSVSIAAGEQGSPVDAGVRVVLAQFN